MKSGDLLPAPVGQLVTLFAWAIAVLLTVLISTLGVILRPLAYVFDRGTGRWLHAGAVVWARSMLFSIGWLWRVRVEGAENIRPGAHYMIVANHQSLLDILVTLAGLPLSFKFFAKKELFSIPFLGWHMTGAGYIPIDRGNSRSGRGALERAGDWLDKNLSVLFFPEGTRSPDSQIQVFRQGAFRLAIEKKTEILPVVIDGTGWAIPKGTRMINRSTDFIVKIGRPVTPEENETAAALGQKIRAQMIETLAGIRGRTQ